MIFKDKGLLGINARNLLYIRPYNKKKAIKLADDKIKTKQFLSTREIPVPKLYAVIKDSKELERFEFSSLQIPFVLKPNQGYGGEGIIPIIDKRDNFYITAGGKQLSEEDLREHIQDIIDGRYSISNVGDYAFMEQFIVADERVGKFSYEGLPDIRVVVHNLIPVMAMLRIPTKESAGKANLHMGAVGVGIDIAKGEATNIAYKNRIIEELPDGLGKIRGTKIPYWDEILLIASKVQLLTNLGYMAIDLCIDQHTGPVLLEINARAGLGVQIANMAPLRRRLERIEGVKVLSPVKGVRIAKDMFGNIVEKEIEHLSGKQVIGIEEEVEIITKTGTILIPGRVDTSKNASHLCKKFAIEMGLAKEEEENIKLKFAIGEKRIQTVVELKEFDSTEKIVLGKRDLKDFLIDSSHIKQKDVEELKSQPKPEIKTVAPKINFSKTDQQLIELDNQIKLLYHLKPTNLEDEKRKFFDDINYNPQFEYPDLKFDPVEITDRLEKVKTDDSPIGLIFAAKKKEILNKVKLLDSIGEESFTQHSIELFGKPSEGEVEHCKELIKQIEFEKIKNDQESLSAERAKKRFEQVFELYGLKSWKVKIKESMVADCVAGKNNRLFIREGAKFSKERIDNLIVHEIETHIITAENGKLQNYEIFNKGLANYLITQEGMAMYNVEQQSGEKFQRNHSALAHVIAIDMSQRASFAEVYAKLIEMGIPKYSAFKSCLKSKRGQYNTKHPGAFTKDYVYFRGYLQVKGFIENGGDMKDLYIGKLNIDDLDTVKSISGISGARILPKWLKSKK